MYSSPFFQSSWIQISYWWGELIFFIRSVKIFLNTEDLDDSRHHICIDWSASKNESTVVKSILPSKRITNAIQFLKESVLLQDTFFPETHRVLESSGVVGLSPTWNVWAWPETNRARPDKFEDFRLKFLRNHHKIKDFVGIHCPIIVRLNHDKPKNWQFSLNPYKKITLQKERRIYRWKLDRLIVRLDPDKS